MNRYKTIFSESFDDGEMEPHAIEAYNIVRGISERLEAENYNVSSSDGENDDTIFYLTISKGRGSRPGGLLGVIREVIDGFPGVEIVEIGDAGVGKRDIVIKIPYDIGHTGEQ